MLERREIGQHCRCQSADCLRCVEGCVVYGKDVLDQWFMPQVGGLVGLHVNHHVSSESVLLGQRQLGEVGRPVVIGV